MFYYDSRLFQKTNQCNIAWHGKETKSFFSYLLWFPSDNRIKLWVKVIKLRTTLIQLQIHSEQPDSVHIIVILLAFFFYSFHSFFCLLRECVLHVIWNPWSSHSDLLICFIGFRLIKLAVLAFLLSASVETERWTNSGGTFPWLNSWD